jgi:PAS domain S-box-containing protein
VSEPDVQPIATVLSAQQALQFLADAGELLSRSLDYAQTVRQVAQLAVPQLADWCAVFLAADGDAELEITSGHTDPELEAVLLAIRRRRRAVQDASESVRVARTAQPILAPDVRGAFAADVEEGELELIERLQPRSYMLVPLLAHGRILGSLTLLSTREGRHYTAADLELAQTIAGRCALAIDNARVHDAAERSLSLLDTIFATAPVGLAFLDRDLRFVRVNETMAAMNHRPVESHPGRPLAELLGEDASELVDLYRRVLDTGEPVHDLEISGREAGGGRDVRHFQVSRTPVHSAAGDALGVSVVVHDVTERQRLLEGERAGRARADFLSRAGALLDETLDYEQTLRAVADIAVPHVADWCGVSVLDEQGALRRVATAHVDPRQREVGEELDRRFPPEPGNSSGTSQVARTGRTEFVREITDEMLVAGIPDPGQLALVRRLRLRSVIIAALRARGRIFGTLTLANAAPSRLFDDADVQLAEELALRAGTAIDNARLYTERTHIAHTLQARLLPDRLPEIPGVVLAARYRAAGELNEVGGDFYDVFARSEHQWAVVVGDVSGKGPEAAAVTALARYTLRAGAREDDRPAKGLARVNAAMLAQRGINQYATAAFAHLSPRPDGRLLVTLALAGHPPALLLRRDRSVETLGRFGSMLALDAHPEFIETDHALGAGDLLLLYTDGVTEAGPRRAPLGEAGLAAVLRGLAGQPPQIVVEAVETAARDAQEGEPRDDIALVAIARAPE